MSEYIHIFAADKDHSIFLPLGCWSRNSAIYKLLHEFAPWESIAPLSLNHLKKQAYEIASRMITEYQDYIRRNNDKIALVATWNNSVPDKAEYTYELQQANFDYEVEINDWKYAKHYLSFLIDIMQSGTELFVGIECGYQVTKEDINSDF